MTRNHQSYWILLASSCSSIICWHRLPKEANLFGERWIIQQDPKYLQTPVTFGFGHRSNFWAWYLAQWYRYRSLDHSIFVRLCSVPHPTCCWNPSQWPLVWPSPPRCKYRWPFGRCTKKLQEIKRDVFLLLICPYHLSQFQLQFHRSFTFSKPKFAGTSHSTCFRQLAFPKRPYLSEKLSKGFFCIIGSGLWQQPPRGLWQVRG